MSKNAKHFSIVGVFILILTGLVYWAISGYFFELPTAAATQALLIDEMFTGHYILIAFLFSIVVVPLVYSIIVFRQQEGDDTDAPHIHENVTLEIAWTVIPIIIVIAFGVWGVVSYNEVRAATPGEVLIRSEAQKWDWTFFYPEENHISSQSLVLEVGVPVHLELQSRDIIHSFWVPKFRVKQDAFPFDTENSAVSFASGVDYDPEPFHYTSQELRFTPVMEGVYRVRCAEICGTDHYAMLANVFVLSSANYQAWLAGDFLLPPDPSKQNMETNPDEFVVGYLDELKYFNINTGYSPPPDPLLVPATEGGE